MKVNVNYKLKTVPMAVLKEAQKIDQVLGYCKNCSNYEKNHSCPDFEFEAAKYLDDYRYATIIMTEINGELLLPYADELKQKVYPSRVFDNYNKEKMRDDQMWSSMFSMYVFNEVKDDVAGRLLAIERDIVGSIGLPPGSCTACKTCTKKLGLECVDVEKLRYSLEALGFLVSDVYKNVFDMTLSWSEDDIPDAFRSCSALISKEPVDEAIIEKHLQGMVLEV